MLPMIEVPETIRQGMFLYRDLFCREEGVDHVSRYVAGLIISPNKTLQGIYDLQVWEGEPPRRRAMHAAVFEVGWQADALMPRHRRVVARDHRGQGREVISLDWTFSHHEQGPKIFGTKRGYDYVEGRLGRFQKFGKQRTGLESAQVRKEEAVKRHFRLSCVAQSLLQRASAPTSESERFAFAQGKITAGQRCRVIAREVLRSLLELAKRLFAEGKLCEQVLDMLMPA